MRGAGRMWQYYVGFGVSRAATIVVLPVLSRKLGPAGFGYFEASLAVVLASMIVADAGVGAAVVRYLVPGSRDVRELVGSAVTIQLSASLVAFAVFLVPLLVVADPRASRLELAAALLAFTLIEGLSVVGAAILRAQDRFSAFLWLSGVRLVLALGAGTLGAEIGGVAGALAGVAVAGLGFASVTVGELIRRGASAGSTAWRRRVLVYGIPLISTSVMTWVLALSDRLFLRASVTPQAIAQYSASYRLGSLITIFVASPVAVAWVPYLRRLAPERVHGETVKWGTVLTVVSLGGSVVLVAAAAPLVRLVFGGEYDADSLVVACSAAGGWLFGLYFLLASNVLVGDRTHALAGVVAVAIAVNVAANLLLVPAYGGRGAAEATIISYGALAFVAALAARRHGSIAWLWSPAHVAATVLLGGAVVALASAT